jgi:hypothetical protein
MPREDKSQWNVTIHLVYRLKQWFEARQSIFENSRCYGNLSY